MGWSSWKELRPFTDYFEILPFVGHPERRDTWNTTLEGTTGYLSSAEGLIPKGGTDFDYQTLNNERPGTPAPIGVYFIRINGATDEHPSGFYDYIGLSASVPDFSKGKKNSLSNGIYNRIHDHYRKIVGLPHRGAIGKYLLKKNPQWEGDMTRAVEWFANKTFEDYEELRELFGDLVDNKTFRVISDKFRNRLNTIGSIQEFFRENVEFSYNTYTSSSQSEPARLREIAKGEGLALQAYKVRWGEYPFLNTRDETKALKKIENIVPST